MPMRGLRVLPLLLTVAIIWALNHSFSASVPAFGKIMDPVNGIMANAESINEDFNKNLRLKELHAPVSIWMDTALIPHIRAGNDHDLYCTQGYIHAYFRLWQMDMQTRAAWGRVSEVAGPKAIDFDRGMRREGMVWGAQHSLDAMEKDPRTKAMLDAYRDGINAYVHSLNYRGLPLEYKLMGFAPEDWTNLRTALLMKYMARDLTGKTDDIAYTLLRDQLGQQQFDFLFPEKIKGSKPVIPEGTKFDPPSLAKPSVPVGDPWAHFGLDSQKSAGGSWQSGEQHKAAADSQRLCHSESSYAPHSRRFLPDDKDWAGSPGVRDVYGQSEMRNPQSEISEGSNNWAIAGQHTASGKAILCNDPHLGLNLPSLWFEMQLTAPGVNCYGASLPGAPGIVIGFNDKIGWGFTNNYRDVKDFYEIVPSGSRHAELVSASIGPDSSWQRPSEYLFGQQERSAHSLPFQKSIEVIKVRGQKDFIDTVLYTIHGPVTYDPAFPAPDVGTRRGAFPMLACTWMAHRGSNELLATYLLNRAGDYKAFTDAISHFECPAQNIAYADGANNIAMWGQGRFINKWKDQGKYVMRGDDSSTLWGQDIPMSENPHVLNPPQGFVVSANQTVTDSTYPYWYNQSNVEWRSWEINRMLSAQRFMDRLKIVGVDTMMGGLQNDNLSLLLENMPDRIWGFVSASEFNKMLPNDLRSLSLFDRFNGWNFYSLYPDNYKASLYQIWWSQLYKDIWQDEFPKGITKWPSSELTVQLLLSDSTSRYYDDKRTPQVETLRDIVQRAFKETTDSLNTLRQAQGDNIGVAVGRNAPRRVPTDTRSGANTDADADALQWYKVKNTTLTHLAKIPAFSYDHLKIGGWSNTINACTGNHGPSWRMIVEMDSIPKAYTIYPGGQSGNPGSPYYSDFIEQWVEGQYHEAQFITASTTKNSLKYTWTIAP